MEYESSALKPERTYKDRLFRMIFKEKREFLQLYNAMNGTSYENTEDLTVTTLENAVYMGMRNDISFLLYEQLTLYEHQSTLNPNLPLRNLFYVSDIYSNLTKDANLYGSKLIRLPAPHFVVFYNGVEKLEERSVLKLSDAFAKTEEIKLELEVFVLNINLGFNKELMEKCKSLREYMIFVTRVRDYSKKMPLPEAVEQAIQECIEEGVLAEFLFKNRAEVKKVSIYEYDEEKHIQQERADAKEDGRIEGRREGRIEGRMEGQMENSIRLICTNRQKGIGEEAIAEFLGTETAFVHQIISLAEQNPEADAETLLKIYQKEELGETERR